METHETNTAAPELQGPREALAPVPFLLDEGGKPIIGRTRIRGPSNAGRGMGLLPGRRHPSHQQQSAFSPKTKRYRDEVIHHGISAARNASRGNSGMLVRGSHLLSVQEIVDLYRSDFLWRTDRGIDSWFQGRGFLGNLTEQPL
jgi:hypothetical protein